VSITITILQCTHAHKQFNINNNNNHHQCCECEVSKFQMSHFSFSLSLSHTQNQPTWLSSSSSVNIRTHTTNITHIHIHINFYYNTHHLQCYLITFYTGAKSHPSSYTHNLKPNKCIILHNLISLCPYSNINNVKVVKFLSTIRTMGEKLIHKSVRDGCKIDSVFSPH